MEALPTKAGSTVVLPESQNINKYSRSTFAGGAAVLSAVDLLFVKNRVIQEILDCVLQRTILLN